jgi:hypothetical protein
MPYIIITRPRYARVAREPEPAIRTAVATLGEAHNAVHGIVHEAYRLAYPLKPHGLGGEHSDAQRAHRWHNVDVSKLPESGGTVGPLPDGTVIEVRSVPWAGSDGMYALAGWDGISPNFGDPIAAFNAR